MSIELLPTHPGNKEIAVLDMVTPYEFIVKENDDPNIVSCGIAVNQKDLYQRLEIVTDRYLRAGYITPDTLNNGVYRDEYEDMSVPFIAKIGKGTAASLRLIPNMPGSGLPINASSDITVTDEWKQKIDAVPFEVSQLAKSLEYYHDPRTTLGLIRTYFAYAQYHNMLEAAAVADNRVKQMLNGKYMSFGLPDVGPSVDYLGSPSTPIYINVAQVIENTANAGHQELARFLETGKAEGFEWYSGM